jgi:uncharacterized delta-60 repeat protein
MTSLQMILEKRITMILLSFVLTTTVLGQARINDWLDPTFGTAGKIVTQIDGDYSTGYDVALQADGKIVVVGGNDKGSNGDFAVVRYNSNGTLDTTFGRAGIVTTAIGTGSWFDDQKKRSRRKSNYAVASGVAIQTDGKIVVVGYAFNKSNYDFALARYDSKGKLDASFGKNGIVLTPIGRYHDEAFAVAIQADGKIVVAGFSMENGDNKYNGIDTTDHEVFALARYTSAGALDVSFGKGGKVVTPKSFISGRASDFKIQSDGKIIAAGYDSIGSNVNFAVVRYNLNGTLDTGFGTAGKVSTDFDGRDDFGEAVALQPDGKILITGSTYSSAREDTAIARYNPDGTLDNSFGTNGKIITSLGTKGDGPKDVFVQRNGKIVVAGSSEDNGLTPDFTLVRYNTNGAPDTSFGIAGRITTDFAKDIDYGWSAVVQPDGKIVVVGYSFSGKKSNIALARYIIDSPK